MKHTVWTEIQAGRYHDAILDILCQCNPYCCFVFNHKWTKQNKSRKSTPVSFRCRGSCKFDDCPVRFCVEINNQDSPKQFEVLVTFTSNLVQHKRSERRSRHVTGQKREDMVKLLSQQSPSTVYNKKFASLTPTELECGKRDKVGSSEYVLRKISSEGRKKLFPHFDLITSLSILRETLSNRTTVKSLQGYIQRINCFPFSVTCFTEEGVRIYHHLGRSQNLFCDATGTIVSLKGTQYEGDTPLYYSLVIKHPCGGAPVAIAEFIAAEHSVLAVSHFLESFRRAEACIYGYKNVITPKHVVIDRSLVLLLSFLRVYNFETVSDYLH